MHYADEQSSLLSLTEQLPDDATAIAVGNLDGDRLEDAAILAGGKVYVLRGSGPLAAVSTPASVRVPRSGRASVPAACSGRGSVLAPSSGRGAVAARGSVGCVPTAVVAVSLTGAPPSFRRGR